MDLEFKMSEKNLVYLATPYSHPDKAVRKGRYNLVTQIAAHYSKLGHIIFSPITHSHPMTTYLNMPTTWEFWKRFDFAFLKHCHTIMVVTIDGWETSVGVQAEIAFAKENNIDIIFVDPDTFELEWEESNGYHKT